jgi:hypothetical protein
LAHPAISIPPAADAAMSADTLRRFLPVISLLQKAVESNSPSVGEEENL